MPELKTIEKILDINKTQAINCCKAYNIDDGLLLNFCGQSPEFKRLYNKNPVNPTKSQDII